MSKTTADPSGEGEAEPIRSADFLIVMGFGSPAGLRTLIVVSPPSWPRKTSVEPSADGVGALPVKVRTVLSASPNRTNERAPPCPGRPPPREPCGAAGAVGDAVPAGLAVGVGGSGAMKGETPATV